jgi:nicotinate-nucleotide adenylyltransferase
VRLAIFGGTFDPVHNAHLAVAKAAAGQERLEQVLFVPASQPPHKGAGAWVSYGHRYNMVVIACAEDRRFAPSRLEQGAGNSYSIDTIGRLRAALTPGDELFFIIGADAFAEIGTWRRWKDVVASVEFIVVSRPGFECEIPPGSRAHWLEGVTLPVSSTEIRRKLAAGLEPPEVPAPVLQYIREHGLYRAQM